jgi:hypothetical protein
VATPHPRRRRRLLAPLGAGLAAAVLAGCGGSAPSVPANPVGSARGQFTTATLVVTSGFTAVDVSSGALGPALFSARTPRGSGIVPVAHGHGSTVDIGQRSVGPRSASEQTLSVVLARGVRWDIDLDGGASRETVDMHLGRLSSLRFGAGVSSAAVRLPAPDGTLTLTLAGGASRLAVEAPAGPPAQVRALGGASTVSVDGTVHSGVAGGTVFTDPGWSTAANRYLLNLTSGVSDMQLTRI